MGYWDLNLTLLEGYWDMNLTVLVVYSDMNLIVLVGYWDLNLTLLVGYSYMNLTVLVEYWDVNLTILMGYWDVNFTVLVDYSDVNLTVVVGYWDVNLTLLVQYSDVNLTVLVEYWDMNLTLLVGYWDVNRTVPVQYSDMNLTVPVRYSDVKSLSTAVIKVSSNLHCCCSFKLRLQFAPTSRHELLTSVLNNWTSLQWHINVSHLSNCITITFTFCLISLFLSREIAVAELTPTNSVRILHHYYRWSYVITHYYVTSDYWSTDSSEKCKQLYVTCLLIGLHPVSKLLYATHAT